VVGLKPNGSWRFTSGRGKFGVFDLFTADQFTF
jgi:hypothetical protein